MRNEQIKRMAAMMAEYDELQAKRNEIKDQIEELERKARAIKAEQQHKGDLLAKLGNIATNNTYYEYQCKVKKLIESYKGQEITEEIKAKIKAETDKIHDECFEIVYTPCKPRQWYMRDAGRCWSTAKRYYMHIENYNYENRNIERYDTSDYTYSIIIQERPELKRYKWEIEASYPDSNKYRENITNTTKYKTLEELAKALPDIMTEVEQVYKEHYSELFTIAPDIFDFETIKTEIELPFEVTSKNIVKVEGRA
jgi:hypothetical protein